MGYGNPGNFVQGAMRNALSIQTDPSGSLANAQKAFASSGNLALKLTALIDAEEKQKHDMLIADQEMTLDKIKEGNLVDYRNETLDDADRSRAETIRNNNLTDARGVEANKIKRLNAETNKKDFQLKRNELALKVAGATEPVENNPDGSTNSAWEEWNQSQMNPVAKSVYDAAGITGLKLNIGGQSPVERTGQSPVLPTVPASPDQVAQGNELVNNPSNPFSSPPTAENLASQNAKMLVGAGAMTDQPTDPLGISAVNMKTSPEKLVTSLISNDGTYRELKDNRYVDKKATGDMDEYRSIASTATGIPAEKILNGKAAKSVATKYVSKEPFDFLRKYASPPADLKDTAIKSLATTYATSDNNDFGSKTLRQVAQLIIKNPSYEKQFIGAVEEVTGNSMSGDIPIGRITNMKRAYEIQSTTPDITEKGKLVYDEQLASKDTTIASMQAYLQGIIHDMGPVDKISGMLQSDYVKQTNSLMGITSYEDMKNYGDSFLSRAGVLDEIAELTDIQFGGTSLHFDRIEKAAKNINKVDKSLGMSNVKGVVEEYKEKVKLSRLIDDANINRLPTKEELQQWIEEDPAQTILGKYGNRPDIRVGRNKAKLARYIVDQKIDSSNFMGRPSGQVKAEMWKDIDTSRIKDKMASQKTMSKDEKTVIAFLKIVDMVKISHLKPIQKPITGQILDTVNSAGASVYDTVFGE